VLAQALFDNDRKTQESPGRLYSVEEYQQWADATARGMPARLAPLVELIQSPTIEMELAGASGLRHVFVPDFDVDFIHLDGPDHRPGRRGKDVTFDVLDLEPQFRPGFKMLVDGRIRTVNFL